jgi:hypothetical protein
MGASLERMERASIAQTYGVCSTDGYPSMKVPIMDADLQDFQDWQDKIEKVYPVNLRNPEDLRSIY